jgi:tetratricopeptide (TPR) repeat protein
MKNFWRCFSLLSAILFATAIHQRASGQDYYNMGVHAYFSSDDSAEEALRLFTQAIEHKQSLAKSYLMRGASKEILKQYPEALEDLQASQALDVSNPRLFYYYGQLYFREGLNYRAIHYFDSAIAKDAKSADFYNARAIVESTQGAFDKVLADEDMALRLDSVNDNYLINRGFARTRLNEPDEAVADYNRALTIKKTQKGFANRGYAYAQLGKFEQAIADHTSALTFNPSDGQVLCLRGICFKALGKKESACADFKKSAALQYQPALQLVRDNCD